MKTELEGQLPGVKNYCVAIKENGEDVVFLRRIYRGSGDQSYGIEVAKLAGLPDWVVNRSREILSELLDRDIAKRAGNIKAKSHVKKVKEEPNVAQLSLFGGGAEEKDAIIDTIKGLKIMEMNPMEAMNALYALYQQAKDL